MTQIESTGAHARGTDAYFADIEAEVTKTLKTFKPNGDELIEIRALVVGDKAATRRIYSRDQKILKAEVLRLERDGAKPYQYYFILNEISKALDNRCSTKVKSGSSTRGEHIKRRMFIPLDFDPIRAPGYEKESATDAEIALAREAQQNAKALLTQHGFPDPIEGFSGNGYWSLYDIDAPADIKTHDLIVGLLKYVDNNTEHPGVIVDASIFDANRIAKLFGTYARKGDNTTERPHRMSKIIAVPAERRLVDIETLEALVPLAPAMKVRITNDDADALENRLISGGIKIFKRKKIDIGILWETDTCALDKTHNTGCAFVILRYDGQIEAGCHHEHCKEDPRDAWALLLEKIDPDHQMPRYYHDHPYGVKDGCIVMWTEKTEKIDGNTNTEYVPVPLTNFTAHITREIKYDNDREVLTFYDIIGKRDDGLALPEIRVGIDEFDSMKWIHQWGGNTRVHVGRFFRDHAASAIHFMSLNNGFERKNVYGHIGFRQMDGGEYVYLSQGGAVGKDGMNTDIAVILEDDEVMCFELEEPPVGEDLRLNVKQTISLLKNATPDGNSKGAGNIAERLIFYDIAAVFRAPLNEILPIITSLFDFGTTGGMKTAYAAFVQAYWGRRFTSRTLPANWSSTANRNEAVLYRCKDAMCVLDDYKPGGDARSVGVKENEGDRILRGQADNAGRGRMTQDLGLAKTQYSRAFLRVTAEDTLQRESGLARACIREIKREEEKNGRVIQYGDVPTAWMKERQREAAAGVYVKTTSAYGSWLCPQIMPLKESNELFQLFENKRDEYRERPIPGAHFRVYEMMADFFIGWEMFMRFALSVGAIDEVERRELTAIFERVSRENGERQSAYTKSSEPATVFLDTLSELLKSKQAHLAEGRDIKDDITGTFEEVPQHPLDPMMLGWSHGHNLMQKNDEGVVDSGARTWKAYGPRIGWVDKTNIYLNPKTAYSAVQTLLGKHGEAIPHKQKRMYEMLREKGFGETESDTSSMGKLTRIQSRPQRVVIVKLSDVLSEAVDGLTQEMWLGDAEKTVREIEKGWL